MDSFSKKKDIFAARVLTAFVVLIFWSGIFFSFFFHSIVSVVSSLFYALSVLLNVDETILVVNILRQSFSDDKSRIWKLKLCFMSVIWVRLPNYIW